MIDHLFRREANVIYDDGSYGLITSAATAARKNSS
jgi:hypothetical protein